MTAIRSLHWLLYITAAPFFVTSFIHVTKAAFFQQEEQDNDKRMNLHVVSLAAFSIAAIAYIARAVPLIWGDLLLIGSCCVLIHGVRAALDFCDGPSSRTWKTVKRHAADSAANFVTIAFVVAVGAQGDSPVAWLGVALGIFLVGKEFVYRTRLDFKVRNMNPRKTPQGGSGPASEPHMATFHAYSNGMKSIAYTIAGFAMIYIALATISISYAELIFTDKALEQQFPQALLFSARNVTLTLSGTSNLSLMFVTGLEWVLMVYMIWSLSKVPATKS